MKIRIGNDIKLVVRLLGNSTIGAINIQSVKAYIINTTMQEAAIDDLKNKTRFISRFPIEPESDAYITTPYNINCSGYPSYRAFPQTCIVGPYSGFGVYPDWNKIYKPVPKYNFIEYPAPVEATSARDVVNVFFPAEAQLFTGDYKLVIVAKIYQAGYSHSNLRTVTMDYKNVFTLVGSSEEGTDSPVTINVNIDDSGSGGGGGDTGDDIYARSGSFDNDSGNIVINMNNGTSFNIDMSAEALWYEGD